MTLYNHYLVYPDGDTQETEIPLTVNMIIDLNGNPLRFPVPDTYIIAYRVYRISTDMKRGEENRLYFLELVPKFELDRLNLGM
ncbi:MAG: hypothetical protein JW874_11235 [Spirochaetales bacterium]|nr:hypothetical protein [Spirochaetales bacterium]